MTIKVQCHICNKLVDIKEAVSDDGLPAHAECLTDKLAQKKE